MAALTLRWRLRTASVLRDPMPWGHAAAFYLGIPLALAILNGANHAGLAHHMSVAGGMLYWAGLCVPLWLAFDLCTRGTAWLLRPWTPPLWIVLFLGATLGLLIAPPFVEGYVQRVAPLLGAAREFEAVRLLRLEPSDLDRVLAVIVWPAFWVGINYYYDRMLSIPRYRGRVMELGRTEASAAVREPTIMPLAGEVAPLAVESVSPTIADPGGSLGFLRQLPPKIGSEIVALQAEDHYVRVYTTHGSALVRYRFKDAVVEVEPLGGLQVHRSFWVRDRHVLRVRTDGDTLQLEMTTGLRVPVSRTSIGAVRARVGRSTTPRRSDENPARP